MNLFQFVLIIYLGLIVLILGLMFMVYHLLDCLLQRTGNQPLIQKTLVQPQPIELAPRTPIMKIPLGT